MRESPICVSSNLIGRSVLERPCVREAMLSDWIRQICQRV